MYKHVISALYVYRLNAFRKSEAIKIFYIMYTLDSPNKSSNCLVGIIMFLFVSMTFLLPSCSPYDEDDATIIAYLKINDLLEDKLLETGSDEILVFKDAIDEHEKIIAANALGSMFGFSTNNTESKLSSYNETAITAFFEKYFNSETETYDMKALENDITTELWNYINFLYTNTIPAKAQNTTEGRYYTISELKSKYPDYKSVELEDFSPMGIITQVEKEKLFGQPSLNNTNINIHTLYVFYLQNKAIEIELQSALNNPEYIKIIKSHLPDPAQEDIDTDGIIKLFMQLSTSEDPSYSNDKEGFEKFANDYFETDIFSGEDLY